MITLSLYSIGLALQAKKKAEELKEPEEESKPVVPKTSEEKLVESQRFYQEAGYAQYAGKYEAPEVPEGYEVEKIEETKEGLSLQYRYVGKPRNITEMFMTWQPTVLGFHLPAKETLKEAEVSRFTPPARIVAGLVSTVEAPVYSVGRLAGFETPPIPVTVSGGLIGSGMQTFWGEKGLQFKPTATEELHESFKHPEYAFGSIVGEMLGVYAVGQATSWTVGKLKITRVGTEVGYQFKQHAPEKLLKLVYGKEMGQAIAIERKFTWGKPVAKGTAGMLEESFGMPFYRAETLHVAMPTKEWARVRYLEWLAPQKRIEHQMSWALGVYPAYGISLKGLALEVTKYPKGLPLSEKLAQAEQIPVYNIQKEMMLTFEGGQLKQRIFEKWTMPTGKQTAFTYREAFEFEQATKMVMPTKFYTPSISKDFFKTFRGTPTTPFTVTLQKAIGMETTKMMGGLSLERLAPRVKRGFLIQPPSPSTFYKAPVRLTGKKASFTPLYKTPQIIISTAKPRLSETLGLAATSLPKSLQRPSLSLKQAPIQIEKVMQKQIQRQKKRLITTSTFILPKANGSITTFKPPILWNPRKRKKSKVRGGLFGKWFLRTHPIKTHEEMMQSFTGRPPKRKKRKARKKRRKK